MSRVPAQREPGAALYGRTSLPRQKTVDEQIELCRDLADKREIPVRFILRERGESAKSTDRPMMVRMMDLVRDERINTIIVWKMDRMVRSLRDLLNIHNVLEDHGVGLISVTEPFDTTTSYGRFVFRTLASVAELERELIAERAGLGKMRMARAAKWPTGIPPFGYRLTADQRLQKYEPQAMRVRQIYAWYNQGLPITEISMRLGQLGVLTPRERSPSPGWVHHIIHNPLYKGQMELLDFVHDMPELRIVKPVTWQKAQEPRRVVSKKEEAAKRRKAAIDAVFDSYLDALADDDHESSAS